MAGATLSGTVFTDANGNGTRDANETGLAGFSVDLLNAVGSVTATTTSNASGAYNFSGLAAGTYTLRFTPSATGYSASTGTTGTDGKTLVTGVSVPASGTATFNEGFYKPGTIAGIVYNDANGNGVFNSGEVLTNGVEVDLYNNVGVLLAQTTSSSTDPFKPGTAGVYSFQNLAPGSYTVSVIAANNMVTSGATSLAETVTSAAVLSSQNFGVKINPPTVSLAGTIFKDVDGNGVQGSGEAGIAGASVLLRDAVTGAALKTTTTDSAGHYSFATTAGNYLITVATPEGLKGTTATTLATGSLVAGQSATQLNAGFTTDPVTDKTGAIPATTVLNVVLRGQSNTYFPTIYGDLPKLEAAIEKQLGFDGVHQVVNVIGTHDTANGANTEWPGTGMLTNWLTPVNGDYTQGWTANTQELGLLSALGQLPAAQRAAPTAIVWLHNETDSQNPNFTTAEWESAVRYEAGLVRGVLGQDASTVPYLFVNAIPFPAQTAAVVSTQPVQNQAIRVGQAELTEDKDFNAGYATHQASDVTMDVDGHGITRQPGNVHLDPVDALQIINRVALSVAEEFKASALPGSPVALANGNIDNNGPQVVRADRVAGATNQLLLTVKFDQASSIAALGSAAAAGTGWSLRTDWSAGTSQALATQAVVVDASHILLTFDHDIPAATELFYGWGGDRIAVAGQPGIAAAIYDNNNVPLWVDARGLAVTSASTIGVQSIADSGTGIDGNGNGLLKAGAAVTFSVQFAAAVDVTGTPVLTLNNGATATYAAGSGTNTLSFTYTVASGQDVHDLAVTGLGLTNATLVGHDGSSVALTGFATALPGTLTIDTTAPAQPATPADAAVANGFVDAAANTAAQALTGTAEGGSTVRVYDGTNLVGTTTASGTPGTTGTWSYKVGMLADGTTHSYTATATDAAGNTGPASGALAFTVDTAAPTVVSRTVSPATGDVATGRTLTFALATSEAVTVSGTPTLTLNDGGAATYVGGSGSDRLTFTAVVAAGQDASTLAVTGAALPNGATIRDGAGNDADLSGAAATFTGLTVDTAAPMASSPTLTVAQNAGPTPIGIAAPTDNLTAAGDLTVTAGTLPTDGTVTLATGAAVTAGQVLTAGQLAGLMFTPTPGVAGQVSAFTYTVTDGAGNAAQGTAALDVGGPGAPTITGTHGTSTAAAAPVSPFAGVTVTDPSGAPGATETLSIVLTGQGGTLADGAGYQGPRSLAGGGGSYTLTGTAAQLSQELDALSFAPTAGVAGTTTRTGFVLTDRSTAGPSVADGGTSVTDTAAVIAPATNNAPGPAPDAVSLAPQVSYGHGIFTLTGTAASAAGVSAVEISAVGDDGARHDLGAATLNGDGTFTFQDRLASGSQGFFEATLTDGAGQQSTSADPGFSLTGGPGGRGDARQTTYTADGDAIAATSLFRPDGARRTEIAAGGQTFQSDFFDRFDNHGAPDNTFVFDPGHGLDVVSGFRIGGSDHDTLSLLGSDFGNDIATVLRNAHDGRGGVAILDPTSGDTVKLAGITKAELVHDRRDLTFHG